MKKIFKTLITTFLIMGTTSMTAFAIDHPITGEGTTNVNGTINVEQPGIVSVSYTPNVDINFKYQSVYPTQAGNLNFANNGTTPVNVYFKEALVDQTEGFWKPSTIAIDDAINTIDWNTVDPNVLGLAVNRANGIPEGQDTLGKKIADISPSNNVDTSFVTLIPKRLSETSYKKFGLKLNFIFESVYN